MESPATLDTPTTTTPDALNSKTQPSNATSTSPFNLPNPSCHPSAHQPSQVKPNLPSHPGQTTQGEPANPATSQAGQGSHTSKAGGLTTTASQLISRDIISETAPSAVCHKRPAHCAPAQFLPWLQSVHPTDLVMTPVAAATLQKRFSQYESHRFRRNL